MSAVEEFLAAVGGEGREDAAALIAAIAECTAGGPGAVDAFAAAFTPLAARSGVQMLGVMSVLAATVVGLVELLAEETGVPVDDLRRALVQRGVLPRPPG